MIHKKLIACCSVMICLLLKLASGSSNSAVGPTSPGVGDQRPLSHEASDVEIVVTPQTELVLSDLKPVAKAGRIEGMTYRIANPTDRDVTAVVIFWEFSLPEGVRRVISIDDSWVADKPLLSAGGSEEKALDAYARSRTGRTYKIVARVAYTEFRDGTMMGEDEGAASLRKQRKDFLNSYTHLLGVYENRGESEFRKELYGGRIDGFSKARLQRIYGADGVIAALADIRQVLQTWSHLL
ncbi:MAG: hypothetical protein AB1898_01635 [Acidobacteriota bacterium]